MREPEDLMERLAAADPLREDERLDPAAEGEAEALLARLLATPVAPGPAKRRTRRWTLAIAAVACVAVAAFTAVTLVGSDDDVEQSVAERSIAALAREDSVYHILQRRRVSGDLPRGARTEPVLIESWYASDGRIHETFFADDGGRRGRLLEEVAGRRGRTGQVLRYYADQNRLFAGGIGGGAAGDLPVIDPAGDPGSTLRALEARGALKVDGTTAVGDRRGYRLVSEPIDLDGFEYRFEYVVDAVTYLPLSLRWSMTESGRTTGFDFEYLTYERLDLDARSRARLDLDPHPGAECARGADQAREEELGFPNPCR